MYDVYFIKFKANSRHEIRLGGTNIKFDKEFIRFTTDENCKINTIDGKKINKDFSGTINFKSYEKTSNDVKTFPVTIKAVLEDGTPAEGVTFTANTLAPKMQSYKDTTTGKDGLATVELEGQEGGRQYAFCVAKNAQFMWQGNPGSIVVTIDEKGNISINNKTPNKFGKATFIVEKKDQTYLYTNFKKTLKEAEEKFSSNKYTDESKKELGRVLIGAREEDSKAETLPQYAKGYTEQLKDAIKLLVKKNLPSSKNSNSSKSSSQSSIANKDELTKKEINEKIKYERIAGKDRVLTSISVSKRYYKKSDTVILANADNYADALAASSYASSADALSISPILTRNNSALILVNRENDNLATFKNKYEPSNITAIGGINSISDSVMNNLKK